MSAASLEPAPGPSGEKASGRPGLRLSCRLQGCGLSMCQAYGTRASRIALQTVAPPELTGRPAALEVRRLGSDG